MGSGRRPVLADVPPLFPGYRRKDGTVGIRNEVWIVPTVGCVNRVAEQLAREANRRYADQTDGFFAWTHPYGCSQLGDDHATTQRILAGLVRHPNAAGVLVLGLGCENNLIASFREVLGHGGSRTGLCFWRRSR
jgi:altronate hydrolase